MNETNKATMIELIKNLQAQVEELTKQNKMLRRSLAEIKDVNDEILSDTDDTSYLSGFIDAKASAIELVIGDSDDC